MAVEAKRSTVIANATATPPVLNSPINEKGNLRESQGFINLVNADSIASTYRLFRIRSCDRVSQLLLYGPAVAGAAGDIGLYRTTPDGGAVVDADFFASAQAFTSALNGADVTFEAAAAGGLIANAEKRIWEALGLAADPHLEYDVTVTLTAAATATGLWLARLRYVAGE